MGTEHTDFDEETRLLLHVCMNVSVYSTEKNEEYYCLDSLARANAFMLPFAVLFP